MAEFEPSDSVERDGDVISGADYNSLEQILPDGQPADEHDPFDEAVRASANIVGEEPVGEAAQPASPQREISAAEKAYDQASERVETRVGQGLDRKAAWYEEDPTGQIRKAYQDEEDRAQYALNHRENEKIHQATREAKLAAIEAIYDPKERERERNRFLALERAEESRRHRSS